jgi:hypothetical protein
MKKITTPKCRACNLTPAEFRCIYCADCLKKLANKEIESVLKDTPPLFDHQKKILTEDKKKCGIFQGTGSGKTRTALMLAQGKILIICPKQQRDDKTWQNNAKKFSLDKDLTVVSKEDLRRDWDSLPAYDTVIIDECENNLGVSPDTYQKKGIQYPKTSQIFDATLSYLRKYPPQRFYALSATPIPKPMALWGLATLMGQKWDFYAFRQKYYTEIRIGGRRIWLAKKDAVTKQNLADIVKKFGYTGGLADFFDVPSQTFITVPIELSPAQKKAIDEIVETEADPLVRRGKSRTIENGILYGKEIERVDEKTEKLVKKTKVFESYKIDYILNRAI